MASLANRKPILVVGVGNSIQMDDGVGVHVLRELEKENLPAEVDLLDGGTMGIELLPWLENRDKVILIDAVDAHERPGTIFRFEPDEVEYDMVPKASVHQFGLVDSLQMASLVGRAPRQTVIFGVQPDIIDWGEEPSEAVHGVIPKVTSLVVKEINESVESYRNNSEGGFHE